MKKPKGFQKGHTLSEESKKKISEKLSKKIKFNCDFCGKENQDKPSSYARKKKHFCNKNCYADYRREYYSIEEHNNYQGVRKSGESKQVYHRRYAKNNPDIIAHLKARRYAREKGAIGNHSLEEWNLLKESYGNNCVSCGQNKFLTKDHIIPLSKGGTDFIENIQPLCRSCNSQKHTKIIIFENPELLKQ